jgi:hypothetical protein
VGHGLGISLEKFFATMAPLMMNLCCLIFEMEGIHRWIKMGTLIYQGVLFQ